MVEQARCAPGPGTQRAPVIGFARLTLVDEANDALREAGAVVRLDRAGRENGIRPAARDDLFLPRRRRRRGEAPAELEWKELDDDGHALRVLRCRELRLDVHG